MQVNPWAASQRAQATSNEGTSARAGENSEDPSRILKVATDLPDVNLEDADEARVDPNEEEKEKERDNDNDKENRSVRKSSKNVPCVIHSISRRRPLG